VSLVWNLTTEDVLLGWMIVLELRDLLHALEDVELIDSTLAELRDISDELRVRITARIARLLEHLETILMLEDGVEVT
jgi:hypothetical protein